MRKRKNLFVQADLGKVASDMTEVTSATNTNTTKGIKMNRKDVVIADNPKNKPDTLFRLNKRVDAKVDFFKKMKDEMSNEVFIIEAEAKAGVNLSSDMVTVPTLKWDSKTRTESMVDVVIPKIERLVTLEKMVSSLGAEINRLGYAKTQIMAEAITPGTTGHEMYAMSLAVIKNDTTKSSYPSQEYKALDNSLGLMRSVAYEIRNVILERLNADSYTKRNAGYFQGDARDLKAAATQKKRMLSKADWKLGYVVEQA